MKILALGKPTILSDDGEQLPVRGHQAWAVLAKLLLEDRPIARTRLASDIFPDAADPLGALRWSLAALRRSLGRETLRGDPVELNLPSDVFVDLWEIHSDEFEFGQVGDLLEGSEPASSSGFSTWLLIERERLRNEVSAAARRRALNAISRRDYSTAARLAGVCIDADRFDEGGHVLLVKSLALAGQHETALAHVEATEAEFQAELGVKPTPALRSAARQSIEAPPVGVPNATVVESKLAAGRAALDAGALEAGLDSLRSAAALAEAARDTYLQSKSLLELGTALVHTTRGYDDEGAIILRQAADMAVSCADGILAASALRELGYVDALAGRRPSAQKTLEEAEGYSLGNDDALAGVRAIIGFNLCDWGKYEDGIDQFERATEHARLAGNPRKEAWALGIGAWGLIRTGAIPEARRWLADAGKVCRRLNWVAFQPWVQSAQLEADIRDASGKASASSAERVFAMSCQIGDPCWEAASARVLGLLGQASGQPDAAWDWLTEARHRCNRVTDAWAGLSVAILADRARISLSYRDGESAHEQVRELLEFAARTHANAYLKETASWLD